MNTFYAYEHTRLDTGQIFYVGKGNAKRAFNSYGRSKYWHNIVTKANGFSVHILVAGVDEELAFLVERERIDQLRKLGVNLCNLTAGGEGQTGYRHTLEAREKMSRASKGRGEGIPLSLEAKTKISAALKGKKLTYTRSVETRRLLSMANSGKLHSAETRQKISASLKGKLKGVPKSEEHRARMSKAASMRVATDETRRILSIAGKKRRHSEDTKNKISESQRRRYAAKADRHASDTRTLLDAWPKVK